MSQLDALLNSLSLDDIDTISKNSETEPHIVIGQDRVAVVPEILKRVAVQYDHNIETVTFDCPRYWDKYDMSKMAIYINFRAPNGTVHSHIAQNVVVDALDETIMHFEWTITSILTGMPGRVVFLVCAKSTDENGEVVTHWNSVPNMDMYVEEGMESAIVDIVTQEEDILAQVLMLHNTATGLTQAANRLTEVTLQRAAVYVGSGDMPEGYNVQIDPNGHDIDTFPVQAAIESVLPTPSANYRGKFVLVPTDGTDKLHVCVQVDGGYVWRGFYELGNGSGGTTGGEGGDTGGENTGGDSGDSTDTIATLGKAILGKLILGG